MIKLYWSPRSRSFSALWLMEESGLPYERVLTDISTGAQKTPEYLAVNPMGKVPALDDGDVALGEAAAICAYIADRYPETKLAPPLTIRGAQISALAVLLAELHRARDHPDLHQDRDAQLGRRLGQRNACSTCWTRRSQRDRGFSARNFSAADITIGSGLNFAVRLFKMVPSRPAFDAYIARCMARPAFQRAEKIAAAAATLIAGSSDLPASASGRCCSRNRHSGFRRSRRRRDRTADTAPSRRARRA